MSNIRRLIGIILIIMILPFAFLGCSTKEQGEKEGDEIGSPADDNVGGAEQSTEEQTGSTANSPAGGAEQSTEEQTGSTVNSPAGGATQSTEEQTGSTANSLAGGANQTEEGVKGLSMYDSLGEFNIRELTVREAEEGVKIHEITYDACETEVKKGKSVSAYLVVPEGEGPFPAVIYVHWLGNINSNKNEFLKDSIEMAKRGAVGLLIDGYFPWMERPDGTDKDTALINYQVAELRRCIDLLEDLPFVDSKRLAFVGHDYGAMFGAIMAGSEARVGSYNLVAGMGNFEDWFVTYWVKNATGEYLQKLSESDPIKYIGEASSSSLFFQFSNTDRYIDKQTADEFYEAASQPKDVKFYDSDHRMDLDEIRSDRIEWLSGRLDLE